MYIHRRGFTEEHRKTIKEKDISICPSILIGLNIFLYIMCTSIGSAVANKKIMVVSNNIGNMTGYLPDIEKVDLFLLKKGAPDVVFLQEVPSEYIVKEVAGRLNLSYMVFLTYKTRGSYGEAILAR